MAQALSDLWLRLPLFLRQLIRFGSVSATALIVDVSAYALLIPLIEPAALAAFIAELAAADDGGRSAAAALYRALQNAGLPEAAAANLAHQIHRVAQETTADD